jgi:two-component system chemotaxis sensor kinase CheA
MTSDDNLDDQLLAELRESFMVESREILERLSLLLVNLEHEARPEWVNAAFRETHTLKGVAGFIGLSAIERLARKMEAVFGAVRAGNIGVSQELIAASRQGVTVLADLRADAQAGRSAETDLAALLARLDAVIAGASSGAT